MAIAIPTDFPPSQVYLTIPQAVEHTRRSRATIYRRIRMGEISPIVEDGRTRLLAEQLDRVFVRTDPPVGTWHVPPEHVLNKPAARSLAELAPKLSEARRQRLAALVSPAQRNGTVR